MLTNLIVNPHSHFITVNDYIKLSVIQSMTSEIIYHWALMTKDSQINRGNKTAPLKSAPALLHSDSIRNKTAIWFFFTRNNRLWKMINGKHPVPYNLPRSCFKKLWLYFSFDIIVEMFFNWLAYISEKNSTFGKWAMHGNEAAIIAVPPSAIAGDAHHYDLGSYKSYALIEDTIPS